MGSQQGTRRRNVRPLVDRRNEADERARQWGADAHAAAESGNDAWALECAARAERWMTEFAALDALLGPREKEKQT